MADTVEADGVSFDAAVEADADAQQLLMAAAFSGTAGLGGMADDLTDRCRLQLGPVVPGADIDVAAARPVDVDPHAGVTVSGTGPDTFPATDYPLRSLSSGIRKPPFLIVLRLMRGR